MGIKPETVVRAGLSDDEKWQHALRLNVDRRHLSGEQLKTVIREFHQQHPDISNRKIAQAVGVDHKTVGEALKGRPVGESPHVDTVEGLDGKQYPVNPEQQRETIRETIVQHPEMTDRQIARETGASPTTVGTQRKRMVTVYNPSNRDREALKDPDIQRRLAENDGMNVAGAIHCRN